VTTLEPPLVVREAEIGTDFGGILALYRGHEWSHANDPVRLRRAIECSSYSVVAREDERVVGFARAMSDEAFAVYIADILVAPDRQRRGIGRAVVRGLLRRYPLERFHHQVLVAERGAEGFYQRLGLQPVTEFALTAFIRTRNP